MQRSALGAVLRPLLATLGAVVIAAPSVALANSSGQRTATVVFASPPSQDGYTAASARVTYAFLACSGEISVSYSLVPGSVSPGPQYRFGGALHAVTGSAPQPGSIRFGGTVHRGGTVVGRFSDWNAAGPMGLGCYNQTQKVGVLRDYLPSNATPQQIAAFLNSLTLTADPADPLRSMSFESSLRGEQRRAEQQAAETQRKAEREKAAAAERQRAERAQAAAAQAAAQARPQATVAPRGLAPARPAAPPPPTAAERANRAIQQDQILADQRLAEQRRQYAAQQAAAEQARRDNQALGDAAVTALAPVLSDALDSWIESGERKKAAELGRQYQQAMAGRTCWDAKGVPLARTEIKLDTPLKVMIDGTDCGTQAAYRFEALVFYAVEPMRIRVRATQGGVGQAQPFVEVWANGKVAARGDPCIQIWCNGANVEVRLPAAGAYTIVTGNSIGEGVELVGGFGTANLLLQRLDAPAAPAIPAAAPAVAAAPTVVGAPAGIPPPGRPVARPAHEVAAAPAEKRLIVEADRQKLAGLKSLLAIGWTPARSVEINAQGAAPAGVLNTRCNKLVDPTPLPTLLTYRQRPDGGRPGGVLRFAGEGGRCRPQNAGIIQYEDGAQWIGGVTSLETAPYLPLPEGLGEFRFSDGTTRTMRARRTSDGASWEVAELLVEELPPPPRAKAAKPAAKGKARAKKR
ncbi:hypothetical protein [Phenylobacterium sp.]|jgi:hypothetical protein|uniref:hypothetical protein n=1 Tax=Phenylobacterium sp. TaxID=1871053 RepID=UPI002F94225C